MIVIKRYVILGMSVGTGTHCLLTWHSDWDRFDLCYVYGVASQYLLMTEHVSRSVYIALPCSLLSYISLNSLTTTPIH